MEGRYREFALRFLPVKDIPPDSQKALHDPRGRSLSWKIFLGNPRTHLEWETAVRESWKEDSFGHSGSGRIH
jgi:hypothetical protein